MKVGDLVRYRSWQYYGSSTGLIIEFKPTFSAGGGSAWPSSETHAIVSWSSEKGVWVSNERIEDLEVIDGN